MPDEVEVEDLRLRSGVAELGALGEPQSDLPEPVTAHIVPEHGQQHPVTSDARIGAVGARPRVRVSSTCLATRRGKSSCRGEVRDAEQLLQDQPAPHGVDRILAARQPPSSRSLLHLRMVSFIRRIVATNRGLPGVGGRT